MADKKKLKMGQFAYDLKTNKAVFKIGTETYDVFPIDTKLSETSNNPVSNAVITGKIKEIEEGGGSGYVLPPATAEKLGGIKVGEGLTIASDGTLSANGGETPTTITIDKALDKTSENAIANKPVAEKFEAVDRAIEELTPYTLPIASAEVLGGVKIGDNITISEDGKISAPAPTPGYNLPVASNEVLGGIKIGEGLNITEEGILSVNGGSGGGGSFKEVTKAYYDSLSDEEKKNGTVYFIKDWVPNI